MAFEYFKSKNNGTAFKFAKINGAFKASGIYYGQSGQIDEKLLFSTIIKAAHFVPVPTEQKSPLLEDIGEPTILITERGIIEDFYYGDYINRPTKWNLPAQNPQPLDTHQNKDKDNTSIDINSLVHSVKSKPSLFSIYLNKRSRGDVNVYPGFGIEIGFLKGGTKYSLNFAYTDEGLEESVTEDTDENDKLTHFKGGNFDPEIQDFVQTSSFVGAIRIETYSYEMLISLGRDIFVEPGQAGSNFVKERNLYFSKVFYDAYHDNKLQSAPIQEIEQYYQDIPDGLFLNFSNQTLIQDITKFVVYDALGLVMDYSKIIVKILQNAPDPKSLYDSLYKDASFVFEMYNVVNGEASVTAFCNYLTALGLLYQEIQISQVKDETENPKSGLKVVPMGEGYYFDLANFFVENNQVSIEVYTTYQELSETTSSASPEADFVTRRSYQIQEKFNPMDLVVLRNMDTGEEVVVCALYIQYLIDLGFWGAIIEAVVLIVNIISIFTAAGLIIKGATGIIRIIAIADIAVSSIDILLSNENFKAYLMKTTGGAWFVENWTKISMCLSMSTLSISLAQGIKSYSKEVIEHIDEAKKLDEFKNLDLDEPIDAITKIRKKADEVLDQESKRVTKKIHSGDFEILSENLLKKYIREATQKASRKGVRLEIKWIDDAHPDFLSDTFGKLRNSPKNPKILELHLRPECPKITWFHENWHLEDFLEQGSKKYVQIQKETPWLHEEAVWNRILQNRNKWKSEFELVDSYLYYKSYCIRKKATPTINDELEALLPKYIKQ